jgi:glycosyltransferase involved in cell wall biosynthesis
MKITLLVLTLNEIIGMKEIMPQIQKEWIDQILVLDGGSTDGTIEYAKEQGYDVHVQTKKGIRFAYIESIPMIEGDVIISFSPDGNSPVEAIPRLIKKFKEGDYDLVIGSRYLGDAKSDDDDIVTKFGNWLFTRTVNFLHRANYTDAMVIYRIYKKSIIEQLDLDKDKSYTFVEKIFRTVISWEPLMAVRAAKAKLKIGEIPVDEPERIGGERKLQIFRWGGAYYLQFWLEKFFWKPKKKTPLKK